MDHVFLPFRFVRIFCHIFSSFNIETYSLDENIKLVEIFDDNCGGRGLNNSQLYATGISVAGTDREDLEERVLRWKQQNEIKSLFY